MPRFVKALLFGALAQAGLLALAFVAGALQANTVADALLWNAAIAIRLAGPMPVVGHGGDGGPIYEPTANHIWLGALGIVLGILVYGALIDWVLRHHADRRPSA